MASVAASALSRLLLPVGRAGMATAKAAGKGTLKGIHNASKNMAKAQASNFLRKALKSGNYTGMVTGEAPSVYAREPTVLVQQHMLPPPLQFPAVCACDVHPRAERSPGGKKLLTCHSCAPKGMGVRNYRTQLEGLTFISRGRSSFRSSSPRSRKTSGRKASARSKSSSLSRTRKNKSRSSSGNSS